jgi:hypothetical protein
MTQYYIDQGYIDRGYFEERGAAGDYEAYRRKRRSLQKMRRELELDIALEEAEAEKDRLAAAEVEAREAAQDPAPAPKLDERRLEENEFYEPVRRPMPEQQFNYALAREVIEAEIRIIQRKMKDEEDAAAILFLL